MSLKPLLSLALAAATLGACSGVRLQSEVAPSTYDYQNFMSVYNPLGLCKFLAKGLVWLAAAGVAALLLG